MSIRARTPMDSMTGLPLPIAPELHELPVGRPDIADWHHHFHPASHPALKTVGGVALRNCRIQLVDRRFHNEGQSAYHLFYRGPRVPNDPRKQFRLVVLACAGFLPDEGIDLSSGKPKRIRLSADQVALLRTQTQAEQFGYRYMRYGYAPVREFLVQHALEQDLGHIKPYLIEEFLEPTTGQDRKRYLGHLLLAKKIEVATEPIDQYYVMARQKGLLDPFSPRTVQAFVKRSLGRPQRQEELFFSRLASHLRLMAVGH